MGFQATDQDHSISCKREGITFNAEGVSLIAHFDNELSAYRARKAWINTLHTSFLLQKNKDYDVSIIGSLESGNFVAHCKFTSPCGRYAFWRLINQQAPETERKLAIVSKKQESLKQSVLKRMKDAITTSESPSNIPEETSRGLLGRIFGVFV